MWKRIIKLAKEYPNISKKLRRIAKKIIKDQLKQIFLKEVQYSQLSDVGLEGRRKEYLEKELDSLSTDVIQNCILPDFSTWYEIHADPETWWNWEKKDLIAKGYVVDSDIRPFLAKYLSKKHGEKVEPHHLIPEIIGKIPASVIHDVAVKEGFRLFRETYGPELDQAVRNVGDSLDRIKKAQTSHQKVVAISLALNTAHTSGKMSEYLGLSQEDLTELSNLSAQVNPVRKLTKIAYEELKNKIADIYRLSIEISDMENEFMPEHKEKIKFRKEDTVNRLALSVINEILPVLEDWIKYHTTQDGWYAEKKELFERDGRVSHFDSGKFVIDIREPIKQKFTKLTKKDPEKQYGPGWVREIGKTEKGKQIIKEVAQEIGYPKFREYFGTKLEKAERQIADAANRLKSAKTMADRIIAINQALHVQHVGGYMSDQFGLTQQEMTELSSLEI